MEVVIRVKANHDCWIADMHGDPGRTTLKPCARRWPTKSKGLAALQKLILEYPNRLFTVEAANAPANTKP